MDMTLMESFVAVVDAGSITAASDRIHVSQSALSRRLQQLEDDLGADLLERGRHGVELTAVGRQVLEHGRRLLSRYERMRQDVKEHLSLDQGTIRIGGGATVTSFVMPLAIGEFQADHPGIRFFVKEAGSHEVAAAVASGDLELGVVTLPVPIRDIDLEELTDDEIVLAARSDHPLAHRRVTPADLDGEPLIAFEQGSAIRHIIDGQLRAAGIEVNVAMELRSIPSILKMVATTASLAFVSQLSLDEAEDLLAIPVRGLEITRPLALATRRGHSLSAAAKTFVPFLTRAARR